MPDHVSRQNSARPPARLTLCSLAVSLLLICQAAVSQLTLTEGTNLAADALPADGRIAIDLLGSVWIVPPGGGVAKKVTNGLQPAARPKWSARGDRILYQTVSALGSRLWLLDVDTSRSVALSDHADFDQHPAWHPSGERIVFSSARADSGLDLWEMHLSTGLSWRLSHAQGDETEPTWSANGRDLAWIHRDGDSWSLKLRRHGQREQDLVVSDEPLAAPSWRPDGSLLTFLRKSGDRYSLDMVILSDPPLSRTLIANQDFFLAPASWTDRMHFVYTADGVIKSRNFNEWKSAKVSFTAEVQYPESRTPGRGDIPQLEVVSPPAEVLVVRGARLFDGVTPGYRRNIDVLIRNGIIADVAARRDWNGVTVLDLGAVTILPGFIDSYATLPDRDSRELGRALLSWGVTTIVADNPVNFDPASWETEQSPGPRLLRSAPLAARATDNAVAPLALLTIPASGLADETANNLDISGVPLLAESWRAGIAAGADLLLAADTMPESPRGRSYADVRMMAGAGPVTLVSGLADAGTPGLSHVLQSRQAQAFAHWTAGSATPARRFATVPTLSEGTTTIVGSKPNRLPAGLALHAELQALSAAGLSGNQVLLAAGANAADALGHSRLGRIEAGALADLVLVAGDPLERVTDTMNVVAVVRNGRFYSLVRLLEEAQAIPRAIIQATDGVE